MKILRYLALLTLCFLPGWGLGISNAFDGPLTARNRFPLFLYTNSPAMESARMESSLSAALSFSSLNMIRSSKDWSLRLDMEAEVLDLGFKYVLWDWIEAGVEVPVISLNAGFLDGFVNSFHNAFGFPDYGRSQRPKNGFLYEVARNGRTVVQGKDGRIGFGDLRITAKKALLSGGTSLSVKGDLELPTGDARSGFGNGSVDGGVSLLLDQEISRVVRGYANLGVVFPGRLRAQEGVNLKTFLWGAAAVDVKVSQKIDLIGQVTVQTSPWPKLDIGPVDRTCVQLGVGGRYSFKRSSLELSFVEDLNTAGAPDFTVNLMVKAFLGKK